MTLNRRQFLGIAGSSAGTIATGGLLWKLGGRGSDPVAVSTPTESFAPTSGPAPTPTTGLGTTTTQTTAVAPTTVPQPTQARTLVLVQMSGGNDVLNTLVPVNDGRYHDARPNLGLESDLVALDGLTDYQLHRSLAPLVEPWRNNELAIVQGLALPQQSRSHFVALDTWWSATPELASSGGWIGRWLDTTAGTDSNPLRAVSLGGGAPALTGVDSRPVVVQQLNRYVLDAPRDSAGVIEAFLAMSAPVEQGLFGDVQAAIPVAVDSVDTLQSVFAGAIGDVTYQVEELFHAAAAIIEADVGTEVILINVRGFDTHADQLSRHVELLGGVANGVQALFERLATSGRDQNTLLMAYSEFGRRVAENGSGGTDHGKGGLAFLAGPPVAGRQLVGDVDLGRLDDGDITSTIDARSVYADVLEWLGGPADEVLGGRFDSYSLV